MTASRMARLKKYIKFCMHLIYLISFSYIISQRNYKIETVQTLTRFLRDMKYILIWTDIPGMKYEGQKDFIDKHCEYFNCYFTKNRSLLGDIRYFDVIAFNLQDIVTAGRNDFPKKRSSNQKYLFVANDSAGNYPVCDPIFDNFFNWTWSYRRDSVIPYTFITVYNNKGQDLGHSFSWKKDMNSLTLTARVELNSKHKAAAIMMDKCKTQSRREILVQHLQKELSRYNLTVDVYGDCGPYKCRRRTSKACYYHLKKDYFFYLALEDSIAPDFITNVVRTAYMNTVVPVVFGGADYSKFLPKGSYIDAGAYNVSALASKMYEVMTHKPLYYDYFKWQNHYSIEEGEVMKPCKLCEYLNTPRMLASKGWYIDFRKWWNEDVENACKM